MIASLIAAAAPAVAATAAAAGKAAAPAPNAAATPLQLTPQQLPVQSLQPQTWFQTHAGWLTHTFAGLFILAAIALVILLAVQTTKQEGLSGTVGGSVQSAYRGRPGSEETLKRVTGWAATAFVICATILSLTGI